jgi:hypothetical protein
LQLQKNNCPIAKNLMYYAQNKIKQKSKRYGKKQKERERGNIMIHIYQLSTEKVKRCAG